MSCLRIAAVLVVLLTAAATARAQEIYFNLGSDSALTVLTGDTAGVDLWWSGTFVSQYSISMFMDSARVRVVAADSFPGSQFGAPSVTWVSGEEVVLSATAPGTSSSALARVVFEMDATAQEGSLVSFRVHTLLDGAGADLLPTHRTTLLAVCQAADMYGDVDANRLVNSRDALIALTASVGIPVTGFQVPLADVDLDLQVTSRDALFILSAGVGLSVPFGVMTGQGVANRCAPLESAPADMLFYLSNVVHRIDAGDTVPQPVPVDPSPYNQYRPSWAPDGSRFAYTGWSAITGYSIITADRDGSNLDTLVGTAGTDFAPAWSPDGTRIAFLVTGAAPRGVHIVDADGSNRVHLQGTDTLTMRGDLAWSPDGTRVAFSAYRVCCIHRLWTGDVSGATPLQPVAIQTTQIEEDPSWSPGSDSLLFEVTGNRIAAMAVPDTAGTFVSSLSYQQEYPWWAPGGVVFNSRLRTPYFLVFLRAADGRHLQLTGTSTGPIRLAMRWPNLVYVDAVGVTPASGTIPAGAPLTLTATVTNSDLSTNATASLRWTSRDPAIATVAATGARTADVSGAGTSGQSTWIVVTAGGWRSDSAQVTVQ